jgi:propionate CoA-transferase
MAQADAFGNVNVSRFGQRLAGSGGFINISQNAKRLVFLGTFATPSRCQVHDGLVVVGAGVSAPKFLAEVEQRTFSGARAAAAGQPVLYVTERCVFTLTPDGLALTEIAPGLDLERDVLAHLGFTPAIDGEPACMDPRIFAPQPMALADELLLVPLEARFAYDSERNLFFLNMEGLSLDTHADLDAIRIEVEARLADVGRKVQMVVNYDNFHLATNLTDAYVAVVRGLTERFYASVTRYTTSAFLRLKLGSGLAERGLAPHVYESRAEALR